MRYFVQCPCCPPTKWFWFDSLNEALNHALNRKEYNQRVFGIDFDEVALIEFEVKR